jgi:hypothetical protein
MPRERSRFALGIVAGRRNLIAANVSTSIRPSWSQTSKPHTRKYSETSTGQYYAPTIDHTHIHIQFTPQVSSTISVWVIISVSFITTPALHQQSRKPIREPIGELANQPSWIISSHRATISFIMTNALQRVVSHTQHFPNRDPFA